MKLNLQLFGGRGGGSGLSGGAGGGTAVNGNEARGGDYSDLTDEQLKQRIALAHEFVRAATETGHLANGETAMREGIAMQQELNRREAARESAPTVPKDIRSGSPTTARLKEVTDAAGLQHITREEEATLPKGTKVVVTEPIITHSISNRRDPDGVRFRPATYVGQSSDAFKSPTVEFADGTRKRIETDMPFEGIYKKKS